MITINVGEKFYRFGQNNRLEIIRITDIKSDLKIKIDIFDKPVTKEYIENNYTKLKPDIHLLFAIVNLDKGVKDVVISTYKRKELDEGNNIPYAICRQNVIDVFANQIQLSEVKYAGTSISIDTVPEGVDFRMFTACNGIDKSKSVSCYIDDTLEDILKLINTSKYDNVLKDLSKKMEGSNIIGYKDSVEQLMKETNFMFDFLGSHGIIQLEFKIEKRENSDELIQPQVTYLEDLLKTEMFRTYLIPYDKEIDINKIERSHVIVSDKTGKLYIVAYDKGDYINRAYKNNFKDKRDAIAMLKYTKRS